jgi:hypothetical protein
MRVPEPICAQAPWTRAVQARQAKMSRMPRKFSLRVLCWQAPGTAGNRRVSLDLLDFYHHQLALYGVDTRGYDTVASATILKQLIPGFESGALRSAPIESKFSIDEEIEAYKRVDSGAKEKVVLVFS